MKNKGFSLVEVIVTLGMLSIVTLIITNYMREQSIQESISKYRSEVNTTVSLIKNYLANPDRCDQMLKGKIATQTGTEIPGGLRLTSAETPLLEVKGYDSFSVNSIKLVKSNITDNSFDLVLSFSSRESKKMLSFFSSQRSDIEKRLTLIGSVNGSDVIQSCNSIVSESNVTAKKAFCENLNYYSKNAAVWDSALGKCRINFKKLKCEMPSIPIAFERIGKFICGNVQDYIVYNRLFDFDIKSCPSKQYAVYRLPDGRLTLGCPTPAEKTGPRPLLN